jgi:hypothetical protein
MRTRMESYLRTRMESYLAYFSRHPARRVPSPS